MTSECTLAETRAGLNTDQAIMTEFHVTAKD